MNERQPFVFSLLQNWEMQFQNQVLLYDGTMLQNTIQEMLNRITPVFFIGIGRKRIIAGPFRPCGNSEYSNMPIGIARLEEINPADGKWNIQKLIWTHRVPFLPDPVDLIITKTLHWNHICELFDINPADWRNLIQVTLNLEQIDILADKLREINS